MHFVLQCLQCDELDLLLVVELVRCCGCGVNVAKSVKNLVYGRIKLFANERLHIHHSGTFRID